MTSVELSQTLRLDLPASASALRLIGLYIGELLERAEGIEDPQRTIYGVQLAIHEIAANIVDHAYAGRGDGRVLVTLSIEGCPRRIVAELKDTGRSFDPARVPAPDLREAHEQGYGLHLARALVDRLDYEAGLCGNRWTLVKSF